MSFGDKFNRRHIQGFILTLMSLVLLAACIIIPIPTGEKPYYNAAIASLIAGVTRKDAVLKEFGVPDVTYYQGSELIYIETQESWKVAWAVIDPGLERQQPIPDFLYGVDTLHKRFVLSVSFDTEGLLTTYELDTAGDDFGDCTLHDICLGKTNSVMQYADAAANSAAKKFKPAKDQCSIYLHGPGNKKAYEVSLNGKIPVSMFSTQAFILWTTQPGWQSVVTWPETTFLDFDCKAGEVVFVHFDLIWPGPSKLLLENRVTGAKHISTHRLVLLPDI